jgi:hypothetical protein
MMNRTAYNLGFTAASLRTELARIVAEEYLRLRDWEEVKKIVLGSNALQCRTQSSAKRLEMEIRHRLDILTPDQLELLANATAEDRAAIAWLGVLKTVQFAFDFAAEVLREKLAVQDPVLRHSDYEVFMDAQSVSHPELTKLTNSSRDKIRQVLLLMLVEAGLLVKGLGLGTIVRPVLSPNVLQAIVADSPQWLAGFLVPDYEIMNY